MACPEPIRAQEIKVAFSNQQILSEYKVGDRVQFEHPDGKGPKPATITTITANEQGNKNGVMLQFEDGTFIDVPASRLG